MVDVIELCMNLDPHGPKTVEDFVYMLKADGLIPSEAHSIYELMGSDKEIVYAEMAKFRAAIALKWDKLLKE